MNITKIPFFSKKIPVVSFKAKQDDNVTNSSEAKDMFVKTNSQDYKFMSYQQKMETLNSILNDKLKKCRACINYYNGENDDLCKKTKKSIEKAMEQKRYSLDFLKDALIQIQKAKDLEEKALIAEEVLERYQYVANVVLSEEDLKNANKFSLQKLKETTESLLENQSTIHKYIKQTSDLDDVPRELIEGGRSFDLIARYFLNIRDLPNMEEHSEELFSYASEKANEMIKYRQNFDAEADKYINAIKKEIISAKK